MDLFKQMVLGSTISRDYDLGAQKTTSGLWKVSSATKKKTNQKAAVFIYEIKAADAISGFVNNSASGSKESDKIFEVLKKEATQLTRLRHPTILHVTEPFEDFRISLSFATEPIQICLSNLLNHDLPLGTDYELDPIEIQKGLLQIGKALQFCHSDAKIVHGNLTPASIFINPKGDWKLGGFGFCTYINYQASEPTPLAYYEYDSRLPSACQQSLDYLAPEFIIDQKIDFSNDMFALGCLIYSIFNPRQTLLNTRNNLLTYKSQVERISNLPLTNVPQYFEPLVRKLIVRHPINRITATDYQEASSFDNVLVKTMKFLENLVEQSLDHKASFMQGLIKILPQFPEKVLLRKILPALLEETKDHRLLPCIMPNIIYMVEKINQREFSELVMPGLKPSFLIKGPSQSLNSLLNCLDPIMAKASSEAFKNDILPVVYTSLECHDPEVQDKALKVIPTFTDKLDYTVVKNSLYPKIQNLYTKTNLLAIKVGVLMCFRALLTVLDKSVIVEKLIPLFQATKTKEPGVQLAILGIYQEIGMNYVELEIIACLIIPELWKGSMNHMLNISQYKQLIKSINILSQKVEKEHSAKLETIHKMEQTTKSNTISSKSVQNTSNQTSTMNFEQLINGDKSIAFNTSSTSQRPTAVSIQRDMSSSKSIEDDGALTWSEFATGKKSINGATKAKPLVTPKLTSSKTNDNWDDFFNDEIRNPKQSSFSKPLPFRANPTQNPLPKIAPPNNQLNNNSFNLIAKPNIFQAPLPKIPPPNRPTSTTPNFNLNTSPISMTPSPFSKPTPSPIQIQSSPFSVPLLQPTSANSPLSLKSNKKGFNFSNDIDLFDPLSK